jgi:hypothetical protein
VASIGTGAPPSGAPLVDPLPPVPLLGPPVEPLAPAPLLAPPAAPVPLPVPLDAPGPMLDPLEAPAPLLMSTEPLLPLLSVAPEVPVGLVPTVGSVAVAQATDPTASIDARQYRE